MFGPGLLLQKGQLKPRLLEFCISRFLLLLTEFRTHWAAATISIPLQNADALHCRPPDEFRFECEP